MQIQIQIHIHIHIHIHTHIYMCMYVCVDVCMYIYIYICRERERDVCINIYIYIYIQLCSIVSATLHSVCKIQFSTCCSLVAFPARASMRMQLRKWGSMLFLAFCMLMLVHYVISIRLLWSLLSLVL